MFSAVSAALVPLLSLPSTGAEPPETTVKAGRLAATIRHADAAWQRLELMPDGSNLLRLPAQDPVATLDTSAGQVRSDQPTISTKTELRTTEKGRQLTVIQARKDWLLRYTLHCSASTTSIACQASWKRTGPEPSLVQGATLTIPGLAIDGDPATFCVLPALWPAEHQRFADNRPGHVVQERSWLTGHASQAVVYAPASKIGVFAGHELLLDGTRMIATQRDGAVDLTLTFNVRGRIKPGETWDIGRLHLRVARGDEAAIRRHFGAFTDSLGNGPVAESPDWLDRCAVYSGYPRGPIGVGFNGGGDLRTFAEHLSHVADLGLTTVWLNPIYTSPPGIYGIKDHKAIAKELGTEADLRRFVDRAHELDLRVWLDLVSHGPAKGTPMAKSTPSEAWARDRKGELHMSWGKNLTGDYTHPAWQGVMSDVAAYWVKQFDVDGYRHDCGHGSSGQNWSPEAPYRPSAAGPFGGVELTRVVRDRIRRIKPDAAILSETGGPVFFRSADLLYDYPFYLGCRELTYGMGLEAWITAMRRWLQWSQQTYPSGALGGLLRFLENHDTVRSTNLFGLGPAQALTALAIFAQGTPMLYQEQAIGASRAIRRWLRLRRRLPELHLGRADYQAVRSSHPHVLPLLRMTHEAAAVVAINLSGHNVRTRLAWPAELAARWPVCRDAVTGELIEVRNATCEATLPAYRPVVLALRKQGGSFAALEPERLRLAALPEGAPPKVEQQVRDDEHGGRTYRLALPPLASWFVETGEGVAADVFRKRYRPGEFPTLDACWQPLRHGLWDACATARLGFRTEEGREILVSAIDVGQLRDARIVDAEHDGRGVELILSTRDRGDRPYALEHRAGETTPRALPTVDRDVPGLSIDPFYVVMANDHYRLKLARRHGGAIAALAIGGKPLPTPGLAEVTSEVYTDWGIYRKGRRFGTREVPRPRLSVDHDGGRRTVTFRGALRGPSWNGVQRGWPRNPIMRYRLAYAADASDRLRLTLGATCEKDRPGTSAFLALRWELHGVTGWTLACGDEGELPEAGQRGAPGQGHLADERHAPDERHLASKRHAAGERPGQRVFQSAVVERLRRDWRLTIHTQAGDIEVSHPADGDGLPANTFLLDHRDGRMNLFVALLSGGNVDLKAGVEVVGEVAFRFKGR